jgi:TRAP-type C4-dicarboxylate transport system permease small subunit
MKEGHLIEEVNRQLMGANSTPIEILTFVSIALCIVVVAVGTVRLLKGEIKDYSPPKGVDRKMTLAIVCTGFFMIIVALIMIFFGLPDEIVTPR